MAGKMSHKQNDTRDVHSASIESESPCSNIITNTDEFEISPEALGNDLPKNYYWSPNFIGTMAGFCLGDISGYIALVLTNNSLAAMNASLGPSKDISWVSLANTLGLSVGFLVVGRLSDIFGRRWFFIGGNLLATLGSIINSVVNSINGLIVGSCLLGVAGAVQISFTFAVSELVPNKHRPIVVAAVFSSGVEFAAFGPVVAQSLIVNTTAGWRWIYYLNVIVTGGAALGFFLFYHPPNFHLLHRNTTTWQQFKRLDFPGFVLFTGGLVLFIMGLSWGGSAYPWKSARVISTIVLGFVALSAFIVHEAYFHKGDPLLPLYLFKKPGYLAMVITATVGSCIYYSQGIIWPEQILYLFPGTPVHNGWLACVLGSATLFGQIFGGAYLRLVPKTRWLVIPSCFSLIAFSAAMVSIKPGQQTSAIAILFMLAFFTGIIEIASLGLIPLACPTEDIGVAVGALGSIRSGGATVATAIFTTILSNRINKFLPQYVVPVALDAGVSSPGDLATLISELTAGTLETFPGLSPAMVEEVKTANALAWTESFKYVWYAVIAFAVFASVAGCFTIEYGQFLNDDVARKLRKRKVDNHGSEDEKRGTVVVV